MFWSYLAAQPFVTAVLAIALAGTIVCGAWLLFKRLRKK